MPTDGLCRGPLTIDGITVPGGGVIGLTHCPGRCGVDSDARRWQRDLAGDLAAIEAWGASSVLSLVETAEFHTLGVPSFADHMAGRRFAWRHLPIADMQVPGPATMAAWDTFGAEIISELDRGERVLIHCAAGLGRTGTVAAKLLVDIYGVPPAAAIELVRLRRPGAIETPEQEAFVSSTLHRFSL